NGCGLRVLASETATICFISGGTPSSFGMSSESVVLVPCLRVGRSGSSLSEPVVETLACSFFFLSFLTSSGERRRRDGRSALSSSSVEAVVVASGLVSAAVDGASSLRRFIVGRSGSSLGLFWPWFWVVSVLLVAD